MLVTKFQILGTLNNFVNPKVIESDEHDSIVWTNEEQQHIAKLIENYSYGTGDDCFYVKVDNMRFEYVISPEIPTYLEHI